MLRILKENVYINTLKHIKNTLDAQQKRKAIFMIFLLLLNAGLDVLGVTAIIPLIDAASNMNNIHEKTYLTYLYEVFQIADELIFLFVLSIIVFFILLIKNSFGLFILYIQAKFIFDISLTLSQKFFHHYYEQGNLYIQGDDSGKKTFKFITIPNAFASNYLFQALIFTTESMVIIFMILGIFIWKPILALILGITIVPFLFFVYKWTKVRVKVLGDKKKVLYPKAISKSLEVLNGFPEIQLYGKQNYFYNQFTNNIKSLNDLEVILTGIFTKIPPKTNEIIIGIGIMVLFLLAIMIPSYKEGFLLILGGFGLAAFKIMPSLNRMMNSMIIMKNTSYIIEDINEVKQIKVGSFKTVKKLNFQKQITFKNVSYAYPNTEKRVINDLSLTIKQGEIIGIIGESGAGKSTFLNILLKLICITEGEIFIDNIKLTDKTKTAYQQLIGYVPQEVFIKDGTIRENIAFGEKADEIDEDRINLAIKYAFLQDFISNREKGLETQLGENGAELSGGQKQRIGIARVVYKNNPIMVFDEISSALDLETEQKITQSINLLADQNKTIIIVAHRITTLKATDRIYELKNGNIKKIHHYHELV